MSDDVSIRSVLRAGLMAKDLDVPIKVRLGLFDERTLTVRAYGGGTGLVLVLNDEHDWFPVGRCMLAGPDGVRRTFTEHQRRGGFRLDGERPGYHLPSTPTTGGDHADRC